MSAQHRKREMRHFMLLDRCEQRKAIHRLAVSGMSDYGIAAATALSVEMLRAILVEHRATVEQEA